jgi:hypothetical protein
MPQSSPHRHPVDGPPAPMKCKPISRDQEGSRRRSHGSQEATTDTARSLWRLGEWKSNDPMCSSPRGAEFPGDLVNWCAAEHPEPFNRHCCGQQRMQTLRPPGLPGPLAAGRAPGEKVFVQEQIKIDGDHSDICRGALFLVTVSGYLVTPCSRAQH